MRKVGRLARQAQDEVCALKKQLGKGATDSAAMANYKVCFHKNTNTPRATFVETLNLCH
jgi:hypothetical protein